MPAFPDRDTDHAPTSCSQWFPWGIAFPRLSTTTSPCVHGITYLLWQREARGLGNPPYADITRVQKSCGAHYSRDLLGFPFLFLEGQIVPYRKGRRCCLLAFIPVEKGPVEGCAPGWASPGGPARLPRRGVACARRGRWGARFTPGSFSVHPPRDSCWGGCKTHMTCAGNCCNTLARRREPSQAPRTTGPASCRGRQRAGLPAAPCLHCCPPAARTTGGKAPAAASVLRQARPVGQGCSRGGWHSPGFH